MLELTDGQRERVKELQALADEAKEGDREARKRLRLELRRSSSEIVARCSDTATTYRHMLAQTASGGNVLVEDATVERARLMADELVGQNATPLESLLADRVATLWVLTELQEALTSACYRLGSESSKLFPAYQLQMARLQESANRRYLQAIKTLAQVQRLRGPSTLQVNIGGQHAHVS